MRERSPPLLKDVSQRWSSQEQRGDGRAREREAYRYSTSRLKKQLRANERVSWLVRERRTTVERAH